MISIQDLVKIFNRKLSTGRKNKKVTTKIVALDHVSLTIHEGEIFGLIGPIGAGKTTLTKIISTVILPDAGTVTINGHDVVKEADVARSLIGVASSEASRSFYWRLTGRQNLRFFANLYGMFDKEVEERLDHLFKTFELASWQDELVMKYSTGMKQKLALMRTLLHDPPILLLDEPTTGMDALTSSEIRTYIQNELKNKTILWASHNLHEVERICDRIGMIDHGRIVLEGCPTDLKKNYWSYEKIVLTIEGKSDAFLSGIDDASVQTKNTNVIEIKTNDVSTTLAEITKISAKNGVHVKNIATQTPSLEDIFLEIMRNAKGNS